MSDMLAIPRESLVFHVLVPVVARDGEIRLGYRISAADSVETLDFTERVSLPGGRVGDAASLQTALRLLALAAGLSYYKTCIPATIRVASGLTEIERRFLREIVANGLGEFAYRNGVTEALHPVIDAPDLPSLSDESRTPLKPARALVAVGGGKDSIVTIEALRRMPIDLTLFSVNEYEPIRATADAAGLDLLVAQRRIDPLLFRLNEAGALNGHVPVTSINSLIACLTACRLGYDAVVFSNEASSSQGNLSWEGVDVNHQWSKGVAFEGLLREACATLPVAYFSFLRPLTELAIMHRFAELTSYHQVFTSCNRAFHLDEAKRSRWCGDCPKCRFVFLCLAPFVSRDTVLGIFAGRDLLADPEQRDGFLELLKVGDRMKPFECVGEPQECRAALTLLSRHEEWKAHPFFDDVEVRDAFVDEAAISANFHFRGDHHLPDAYEKAAREIL